MIFEYQGKKVFDGQTVSGFFQMIDGRTFITPFGSSVAKEVVPETVRVFTGKRDRKGNKIHEYDVCRFFIDDPEEDICESDYVVFWEENAGGFFAFWTESTVEVDAFNHYFADNCEVIGNALTDPTLAGVYRALVEAVKSQALRNLAKDVLCTRDVESPSPTDETGEGGADGGAVV